MGGCTTRCRLTLLPGWIFDDPAQFNTKEQSVDCLQRNSRPGEEHVATNGVYQHSLERGASVSMVRIEFDKSLGLFPEVSGSHHRFTVRFMMWQPDEGRPTQCHDDITFRLTIC